MYASLPKEVLVVEDEPIARIVAADALIDRGIMTWEASDAGEALELLEQHPRIGVVVTNVDMAGEASGLALAHDVSAVRPDVKVIVTSTAHRVNEEDLPEQGTFLAKPPTEQLVNVVSEQLDAAR